MDLSVHPPIRPSNTKSRSSLLARSNGNRQKCHQPLGIYIYIFLNQVLKTFTISRWYKCQFSSSFILFLIELFDLYISLAKWVKGCRRHPAIIDKQYCKHVRQVHHYTRRQVFHVFFLYSLCQWSRKMWSVSLREIKRNKETTATRIVSWWILRAR